MEKTILGGTLCEAADVHFGPFKHDYCTVAEKDLMQKLKNN